MSTAPAPAAERVVSCSCCRETYTDPNDLVLMGRLTMQSGVDWLVCGPCIQVMWQERGFRPEIIPV